MTLCAEIVIESRKVLEHNFDAKLKPKKRANAVFMFDCNLLFFGHFFGPLCRYLALSRFPQGRLKIIWNHSLGKHISCCIKSPRLLSHFGIAPFFKSRGDFIQQSAIILSMKSMAVILLPFNSPTVFGRSTATIF